MPTPKEAFFPLTYRAAQVKVIMDAIARRRSIAVYGLAGMGKSNIFRFLAAHAHVKTHYLNDGTDRVRFVYVDCNLGDARTEEGLLRELDFQLARAGFETEPALSQAIFPRHSIRLRLEAADPDHLIVILVDPLDSAFAHFEPSLWSYLRGLRDLQGNVVYVLGARRPPPPLRELQELLTDACWVTPLTRQDALDSLARDANRLNITFAPRDRALLMELSGGHPGLLKNCAELAVRGVVSLRQAQETIVHTMLARETIQEVCRDMWSDFETEWKTLQGLALKLPSVPDSKALEFLERAGVIRKTRAGHELFSPLVRAYIRANLPHTIHIRVVASGAVRVESWQGAHTLAVSDSARQLLCVLAQPPDEIHTRAQLAGALALGDARYSDEAVMAHVKRLRKSLNDALRPLLGDDGFNAIVPARQHGYRLQREFGDWTLHYHCASL